MLTLHPRNLRATKKQLESLVQLCAKEGARNQFRGPTEIVSAILEKMVLDVSELTRREASKVIKFLKNEHYGV